MIFNSFLLAALAVYLVGQAIGARTEPIQSWAMRRLAGRVGLGVPPELDVDIRQRVRRRLVGNAVGGLIGLVLGAGGVFIGGVVAAGGSWSAVVTGTDQLVAIIEAYTALAAAGVGAGLGTALAALRAETRADDSPRVARLRVPRVSEYVPVILRVLAWAAMVCAATSIVCAVVFRSARDSSIIVIPGIALVAIGLLCLVLFEIFSHRIVGRGRPTVSTDQLVWDDALRSENIRDILTAPAQAICLGAFYVALGSGVGGIVVSALILAGVSLVLFAVFSFVFRHTSTWYLEELWPGARRRTPEEESARITRARQTTEASAQ